MLLINHDLLPSQVLAPAVVPARLVGPFTGARPTVVRPGSSHAAARERSLPLAGT